MIDKPVIGFAFGALGLFLMLVIAGLVELFGLLRTHGPALREAIHAALTPQVAVLALALACAWAAAVVREP